MLDLDETFERLSDNEFLKFSRIPKEQRPSNRADLCAFILLDRLLPGSSDIVAGAEHDEVWLEADTEEFAKIATEEDVLYLVRCGVRFDSDVDSFAMFV